MMTAYDLPAPVRTRLTAAVARLRRTRRQAPHPARPVAPATARRRALPLYEALSIGLGCDIASIDRHRRDGGAH